jgi:hypothetical protein
MKTMILASILSITSFAARAQTTPAATKTVTVTWADTTAGATFHVWRWTAGQNGFAVINTVATAVTVIPCVPVVAGQTCYSYTDTIPVGILYAYKVSALNGGQESPQSPEADITVSAPTIVPAVPTNLKVTVVITN